MQNNSSLMLHVTEDKNVHDDSEDEGGGDDDEDEVMDIMIDDLSYQIKSTKTTWHTSNATTATAIGSATKTFHTCNLIFKMKFDTLAKVIEAIL